MRKSNLAALAVLVLAGLVGCNNEPYYANCDEVREAGAAPLHRDDPGYRAELDGNGDGVACEEE